MLRLLNAQYAYTLVRNLVTNAQKHSEIDCHANRTTITRYR